MSKGFRRSAVGMMMVAGGLAAAVPALAAASAPTASGPGASAGIVQCDGKPQKDQRGAIVCNGRARKAARGAVVCNGRPQSRAHGIVVCNGKPQGIVVQSVKPAKAVAGAAPKTAPK